MGEANTLAYNDTATITAVISFIGQANKAVFFVVCDPSMNEL
jgi:hypothetical protein